MKSLLITVILLLTSTAAYADGMFGTSAAYIQYRNDDGKNIAELGLGSSYQINSNLDARMILTANMDGKDDDIRLNIGLLDFHAANQHTGIRLGRIQHELGFYTEQLNWAPARDLHLSPQGIYRENFRYLLRSGDGIQLYDSSRLTPWLTMNLEASFSKPVLYPMKDITNVWSGIGGEINKDNGWVRGLHISFDIIPIATRLKYDQQQLNFDIKDTINNGMFDGDVSTTAHYFGGKTELNDELYVIYEYMEIVKRGSTWNKLDDVARMSNSSINSSENSRGYGLSVGWQINDLFKLIAGHSAFYSYPSDKNGLESSKMTGQPPYSYSSEDNFLALKYRRDDWISTIEVHNTRGTATMTAKDASEKKEFNNRLIFTVTRMF